MAALSSLPGPAHLRVREDMLNGVMRADTARELGVPTHVVAHSRELWRTGDLSIGDDGSLLLRGRPYRGLAGQPVDAPPGADAECEPDGLRDLEIAGYKAEIARLRQPTESPPTARPDLTDFNEVAASAVSRRTDTPRSQASLAFPDTIAIAFIADQHIGAEGVDYDAMLDDAQEIASADGCYVVHLGDLLDNPIKHRGALVAGNPSPHKCVKAARGYLSIFGDHNLAIISGNHDEWTRDQAGLDLIEFVAEDRVLYSPHGVWLEINVGRQRYLIHARHAGPGHSIYNPVHDNGRLLREWGWADVVATGHTHRSAVMTMDAHRPRTAAELSAARSLGDYQLTTLWETILVKPGSYQLTSDYARKFGKAPVRPSVPAVVLHADRYAVSGHHSLQPALEHLAALR